jgi:DMSO/TMAO reductase YedYZ molybdopterin-dependent catalytic subunit
MTQRHANEPTSGPLTFEELQLAARNRGLPLEALQYELTPTGLHYLLTHFDIPVIDPAAWRLRVGGAVDNQLDLTLDELRRRPRRTLPVTLECAGNGRARLNPRPLSQPWLVEAVGTAEWTGTPLAALLAETGPRGDAQEVVFTGADRGIQGDVVHNYARSLTLEQAARSEALLAYEMNGQPLQPQHGFPLRLIVPGWYGMASVKWLSGIDVVTEPFEGYQQAVAYHYRRNADDRGQPVREIRVRALMVPPGIPDFFTRRRVVERGRVVLRGRAWSGQGRVTRVEVAVDGEWRDARLEPPVGEFAWCGWSLDWDAVEGEHTLNCRATDAAGNAQPTEQPWNYEGLGNNQVQQVSVTVA